MSGSLIRKGNFLGFCANIVKDTPDCMCISVHHTSATYVAQAYIVEKKGVESVRASAHNNDYNDYDHRLTLTMFMTSNDNEDRGMRRMTRQDDILSEHPATETVQAMAQLINMVGELPESRRRRIGDKDINHHPSPTSASLGHSPSTVASWQPLMITSSQSHLHRDPRELPDDIWLTPTSRTSSSSGESRPMTSEYHWITSEHLMENDLVYLQAWLCLP